MLPNRKIWICFDKNTDIITPNGINKISDIKKGDMVYSHCGNTKKVYDTMKRWYSGDAYKVSVYGGKDLIVTPEHPFLSIKNTEKYPLTWNKRKDVLKEPEFIEIKNLKEKDYICFPKIQNKLNIGDELSWLLGLFMAEGDCEGYRVNFSLHIDEIRLASKIEKIVRDRFSAKTTLKIIEENNCLSVRVSSKKLVNWIKEKYEGIARGGTKKLTKKGFEFANNGYLEFIKGVVDGDGHIDKDIEIEISQSSESFINQLWFLSRLNGVSSKVSSQKRKGGFKPGSVYWKLRFGGDSKKILNINHKPRKSTFEGRDDYSLLQIRKIEKIKYDDYVYNISVEDDNSYLTMCGAVHNCAPDYNLAKKVFAYLVNFIGKTFEPNEYRVGTKPGMHILFSNGTIVECKSGDNPNSLIGDEVDLLIIDEAAVMASDVYELYLYAATIMRKGTTIFISTPRRKNWFFRKYSELQNDPNGFTLKTPSWINPLVTQEEMDIARRKMPENVFKQEMEAEFLDEGAGVFRKYNEAVVEDIYKKAEISHRYLIGADIARVNDYTVITVIDRQTHHVVHWERFNKVDWALVGERIANVSRMYNNARVTIDSTGLGNPVAEHISRKGIILEDFKFNNQSKKELVEKLSLFFDNEAIFIPNEKELLQELDVFGCELMDNGTVKYGAPNGSHDDCVYSLALAVWGLYDITPQKEIKQKPIDNTPKELRRTRIIKRVR